MATKSQTWIDLARVTGGSPATYAKSDRSLAHHGFGQPGGKGGGRNTVHVGTPYLRNMLLSSTAYFPSDAAAVVRDALNCDYLGSALMVKKITSGGTAVSDPVQVNLSELGAASTFASYLDGCLETFASEAPGTPQTLNGRVIDVAESLIRVDFDPFRAQVEWVTEADAEGGRLLLVHYFVPAREVDARRHMAPEAAAQDVARVRRSSILPASLFFVAARLLADGQAKRGSTLPFSGQGGASASPKTENAPSLPGPRASTRTSQPRELKAGTTTSTRQTMRVSADYQAPTASRGTRHPSEAFTNDSRP